jgi:hypothetical protein
MLQFKQHLAEAWKINNKVSPKNIKLVDKELYMPELEYVSGNDAIIKVKSGRRESAIIYLLVKNGKLVQTSRGTTFTTDKLNQAKFKLEN